MDRVTIIVDDKQTMAQEGQKLLWAVLDAGIYIPNLCAVPERNDPFAGCRLCFVEIEGRAEPVTACTELVSDGMVIHTDTPRVRRLQRTALELLLAAHPVDCRHCIKNKNCELQRIAAFLKVSLKPHRFRKMPSELQVDSSSPNFLLDPNKCVLCSKCIWVCNEVQGVGGIDFTRRGFDAAVGTFLGEPIVESPCTSCGKCIEVCPVGALVYKQ